MSGNNTKRKYSDTLEVLGAVSPKKDDNPLKKYRIPRISRTKSVKLLISIIILLALIINTINCPQRGFSVSQKNKEF